MPPHCLKLKIGCVIMLLRNLDLKAGLCNGTQMKDCALQNNYIGAEVLTAISGGKWVFVPRIQFAPSDSNLPFVLKRRQFPIELAYSMTIKVKVKHSIELGCTSIRALPTSPYKKATIVKQLAIQFNKNLPDMQPTHGPNALNDETKLCVISFFEQDGISRQAPGVCFKNSETTAYEVVATAYKHPISKECTNNAL
ncbi:uncharacterized protein LOC124814028 [Hydra vulgaris]|uniref:uncharacterized protein LOC124814028 n=1 Tax=Hydra vulgaris TaxID=6087 RepID=UPI001F5E9E89|nr:uncharacterized protein LOC124814028 [Hydra vulgaris]